MQPASVEDLRQMTLIVRQQLDASVIRITQNLSHLQNVQGLAAPHSNTQPYGQHLANTRLPFSTLSHHTMQPQHAMQSGNYFNTSSHPNGHLNIGHTNPWFPPSSTAPHSQSVLNIAPFANSGVPAYGNNQSDQNQHRGAMARGSHGRQHHVPAAGAAIPYIKNGPNAWKEAINQWEKGGHNLTCALKDWREEWYTGAMKRSTASRRAQRKLIAEEYQQ